jgi:uncharacterized protein YbjT (DUF2867 family)
MILVVGATGMVGSEICRVLAASGKPVKALVRAASSPSKVKGLADLGATIAQGDLRDLQSLQAACRGVTHVVSSASSIPFAYVPGENSPEQTDRDGAFNLIDAAHGAGVGQFVYVSVPLSPIPFPLADAKRAVEARLIESGLPYTILRPTFFTEVWLGPALGFDHANRKAAIPGDGDNAISWISYRDVAAAAVDALDNPAARNATLDLGGPQPLTPHDVVTIFERAGGRPFDVTHVPVPALQAQFAAATDPMQQSVAALMLGYAFASATDNTAALKALRPPMATVESYARQLSQPEVAGPVKHG